MGSQEFTVLLAEDDDGHALLVRKNLERAGCSGPIVRFRDGQEVLDYLAFAGRSAARLHRGRYCCCWTSTCRGRVAWMC